MISNQSEHSLDEEREVPSLTDHLPVLVLLGVHIRQDGLAGPGHSRPPADTAGPGSPRLRLVLRVGVLETGQAGAGPVKHRTSVKYL